MRGVILAGGKGTRLMPYTTILPKPLIPLGGRPVLELILAQLADAGFTEVDLSVGHLGQLIRTYFTESATLADGLDLRYVWEDEPLGTAGAVRQAIEAPEEPFLVMNGDIVTDLDYRALMDHHHRHRPALTIACYSKDVQLALGVLKTDGEDPQVLTGFEEKPTLSYEVSMGIYVYDPVALAHIPPGRFDFPDLVLALIEAGEEVRTYPFSGRWFDIGTQDEYQRATVEYEGNAARFDPTPEPEA